MTTDAQPFTGWLLAQTDRDDAVGDLARDAHTEHAPHRDRNTWRRYLESAGACPGALRALDRAWYEWKGGSEACGILSLTACGRLAERIVRKAGEPVPVEQLVATLENYDVETTRARAGVALATIVGRLEAVTDREGNTCVRVPTKRAVASHQRTG